MPIARKRANNNVADDLNQVKLNNLLRNEVEKAIQINF